MTLQVPFDQFSQTVQKVLWHRQAFVAHYRGGTLATAASPERNTMVVSIGRLGVQASMARLREEGLEIAEGAWSTDEDLSLDLGAARETYVAAVAYATAETRPGVWIDAFLELPSEVQVLRGMYEEFKGTGEIGEVSFDDFVRLARPTVVIVTPTALAEYARKNDGAEPER